MKGVKCIAMSILACTAALSSQADEAQRSRIHVAFAPTETYSDLAAVPGAQVASLFTSIREAFNRYSDWTLSKDYSLEVEVRDVDLPGWVDTTNIDLPKERKFIDMYPPKIEFSYKVKNSKGDVIYEGYQRLIEYKYLDYLIPRDKPDEYFNNLIASWSVDELRKVDILGAA